MNSVAIRRQMPLGVSVLVFSVFATGSVAGMIAAPILLWLTPAMVCVILLGWLRAVRASDPDADPAELPMLTRWLVRQAFDRLPEGEARQLLRTIVQPTRALFEAARANAPLSPELLEHCSELLVASCATAVELGRLEQLAARDAAIVSSSDRRALRDGIKSGTRLLRERLTNAADALGKLYAQSIERGTVSSERVAELAKDLAAEAVARRRANEELEALLQ